MTVAVEQPAVPFHRGLRGALRTAAKALLYLVASWVALGAVLRTPVIADDFVNPFQQFASQGPGPMPALRYGWVGATEGASFRILGNSVGAGFNWLWIEISARTGIGVAALYAIVKFVVFQACALALAWLWVSVADWAGAPIRLWRALCYSGFSLFLTVQIHALWSNDPVASYPLSGFGSVVFGLVAATTLVRLVVRPTWRRTLLAAFAVAASVMYYELNVAAVAGAMCFVALALWRLPDPQSTRLGLLTRVGLALLPATVLLLIGRVVTSGQASTYAGTTMRLSRRALTVFVEGMLSSVPGFGWTLSERTVTTPMSITARAVLVALVLAAAAIWRLTRQSDSEAQTPLPGDRLVLLATFGFFLTYSSLALALQSITVKVQDESQGVGYVYTAHAVGAVAFAFLIALVARRLVDEPNWRAARVAGAVAAVLFVSVQYSVNERLDNLLDVVYAPNEHLLATFDGDSPQVDRCAALVRWSSGAWPDYYELAMIDGVRDAFRHYFGEEFCPGFVRTP